MEVDTFESIVCIRDQNVRVLSFYDPISVLERQIFHDSAIFLPSNSEL